MQTKPHGPRTTIAVAIVAVLTAASAAWASLTLAQDRPMWSGWSVGEPAARPTTLSDAESTAIRARSKALLDTLGIHPHTIVVARSFDRVVQRTIDSATGFDSTMKPTVSLDWEAGHGHLRALTRYLRDVRVSGSSVQRGDAARASTKLLERAGMRTPPGAPDVAWDQGMQSWLTLWTRHIGGIPAPEDAVSVWVLPDGGLRALSDIASDFTPGAAAIAGSDAEAAVRGYLGRDLDPGFIVVGEARLEWRHPNDFVDPALPDSPDPLLRLVYAVPYAMSLSATERIEAELWVDAVTRSLVGGGAIP